jgi:hypothetical protein
MGGGGMITKDDDVAFSPCWNTVYLFYSVKVHMEGIAFVPCCLHIGLSTPPCCLCRTCH